MYFIQRSSLNGEISLPSSKSHTLRAIVFASLADGVSQIHNYLDSPDTHAMIQACRLFGATIKVEPSNLSILGTKGRFKQTEDVINAGNSGIVLRFCTALGALVNHPVVITGDHSIRHSRPMKPLITALQTLGVNVTSMRGDHFAPLIIQGPIKHNKTSVCGKDSQMVSSLLIAGSFCPHPLSIHVENPGELPWIEMTLSWLDRCGIVYSRDRFHAFRLQGSSVYPSFNYTVPGDLSSLAFPLVAALITQSELTIHNVDLNDVQGDKQIVMILRKMGAIIEERGFSLIVRKTDRLVGIDIDLNGAIDAICALSVAACFAKGKTKIYNVATARNKECDRISVLTEELKKLGATIEAFEDGLIVETSNLTGSLVNSHLDHRMAMALSIAGLGAQGTTSVESTDCIAKTFPFFLTKFQAIGANITDG